MSKPRYYVRKFLNRQHHHAGAYVLAEVPRTRAKGDPADLPWSILEISDCSRRVSLDFPLDARERANSVRKAYLLAEVVRRFADALAEEARLADERQRRHSA